jgi:hypothetical protein
MPDAMKANPELSDVAECSPKQGTNSHGDDTRSSCVGFARRHSNMPTKARKSKGVTAGPTASITPAAQTSNSPGFTGSRA